MKKLSYEKVRVRNVWHPMSNDGPKKPFLKFETACLTTLPITVSYKLL